MADLGPDIAVPWIWAGYAAGRDADVEAALGAPLQCAGADSEALPR